MTEELGGTFGWGMFNCDLASREAGYITGATLHVNGGMYMA